MVGWVKGADVGSSERRGIDCERLCENTYGGGGSGCEREAIQARAAWTLLHHQPELQRL